MLFVIGSLPPWAFTVAVPEWACMDSTLARWLLLVGTVDVHSVQCLLIVLD